MQRVTPDRSWLLHGVAGSRALEKTAAAGLPANALMERAGLAVARLALAIAPHARAIWVACGPGNNGGDGLIAAAHLKQWGKDVVVTRVGDGAPAQFDVAIDAMLGIGASRPLDGAMREWADKMGSSSKPVLAVDIPSGLSSDTGTGDAVRATHTLSLLTLKPGLFTAQGRDACGDIWFDDLAMDVSSHPASAELVGASGRKPRPHDSHKGSWGDVAVIGGAPGMTGAALLAASAALHSGAGRVFVGMLGDPLAVDLEQPELMMRAWDSLDLSAMIVVCGCGGGDAVRAALPKVLSTAKSLVLDADALNAIAADPQLRTQLQSRAKRARPTVITPHPLEAARLLGRSTKDVQSDRLAAAQTLADEYACVVVLKGSGTVIAAPSRTPRINPTGNGRLATAGTGDVLAGFIGANLAHAVFDHGQAADRWPAGDALTASRLARGLRS